MSSKGVISSLKVKHYSKEDADVIKRKENQMRMKKLREDGFSKKRDLDPNLELTNDSIQEISQQKPAKKSTLFRKKKKPPRIELLKQWREQKQQEKEKAKKKSTKPPFVVKHLNHEDVEVFGADQNKNLDSTRRQLDTTSKNNQKVDASKSTYGNTRKKQVLKERSQPTSTIAKENATRRQPPRSCKSKLFDSDEVMIGRLSIEEKPMEEDTCETRKNKKLCDSPPAKDTSDLHDILGLPQHTSFANSLKGDAKDETIESNSLEHELIHPTFNHRQINDADISEVVKEHDISDHVCAPNEEENFDKFLCSTMQTFHHVSPKRNEFEPPKGLGLLDFQFNKENLPEQHSSHKDIEMTMGSPIKNNENQQKPLSNKTLTDLITTPLCNRSKNQPKTPVSLFKDKLNLSMTHSPSPSRRNSLTPNPKNFLSRTQDPVAQRLSSPFVVKKSPESLPNETMQVVQQFTNKVQLEESKFRIYIETWENIMKSSDTPEPVHGDILSAIGQAQLLMRKRFKQFKELIELHKDVKAEKAALASDLDGFWEMVYIQVDDVHQRFSHLEKLKNNQWCAEEQIKPVEKKNIVKKIIKKPKPISAKSTKSRSDFKKFRQQMLAKKKAEEQQVCVEEKTEEKLMESRPFKVDLLSTFNSEKLESKPVMQMESNQLELTPVKSMESAPTVNCDDLMMFSP